MHEQNISTQNFAAKQKRKYLQDVDV